MNDKYYAGIGSRETPSEVLAEMTSIAKRLEAKGYVLRSGGADGADTAFEAGSTNKRIYLPWSGFNGRKGIVCGNVPTHALIARKFHPKWSALTRGAQLLHTRNVSQVLGFYPETTHSEFIVCWTPGGKGSGGTGQAIRIARAYSIPVYDLADEKQKQAFYADKVDYDSSN